MITCSRYHDISCGHRVYGHGSKCRHLHGHNYRIHFTCSADELDTLGMVVDFGFIKSLMCSWLDACWDHKTLLWCDDPLLSELEKLALEVVAVDFNPTAENIALFLLNKQWALPEGVQLTNVLVEETRKCSAGASI